MTSDDKDQSKVVRLLDPPPVPDPNDPLMQAIEALERYTQSVRAEKERKRIRGIRVGPFITVMALGRICEKNHVEARVDWIDGQLQVRLVPIDVEVIPSDE